MKKPILIVALLLSGFVFATATAQVSVSFKINIGTQPVWGPVGYDHVEYYYMPDIDAFYYVPNRQYIYQERGRWIFATSLPRRYRNYDLYSGYKVVVNEPRPYRNAATYRVKYAGYKNNRSQQVIRNSNEPKYFENRNHPQHNKWRNDNNRNNRNKGKGNGRDRNNRN